MAKQIQLTKGKVTIVDDEDFERLSSFKWYARKSSTKWYAARDIFLDGKRLHVHMHREITNAPGEMFVDHINGDALDNTRDNLRICTHQENSCNQLPQKNRSSQYKGVHWNRKKQRWQAYIKANQKRFHLGYFAEEEEAAHAYDAAAIKLFGEFARLNIAHARTVGNVFVIDSDGLVDYMAQTRKEQE